MTGDDVCNNVTGDCPHGCKPHWPGPKCDDKENVTMQDTISPRRCK